MNKLNSFLHNEHGFSALLFSLLIVFNLGAWFTIWANDTNTKAGYFPNTYAAQGIELNKQPTLKESLENIFKDSKTTHID